MNLTIKTGSDDSVLEEHRRVGTGADDFAELYEAAEIGVDFSPIEAVKSFKAGGDCLLFFNPARTAVVCDANAFPDGLDVVDATRLGPEKTESIGKVGAAVLRKLGVVRLSEFLIRASVVQTWIHIESNLELTGQTENSASFRGSHVYFTNTENEDPLAFTIRIDDSGEITVTGELY